MISELKRVRSEAIEHIRAAQLLAQQRRRLMEELIAAGFSQSDLARELGVSRQAIQKMLAGGRDRGR
jgi:predicted transcriptional regulator